MADNPVRLDDLTIDHVRGLHTQGDPLQHLADAVDTAAFMGDISDHLIGHFVDQARRAGASWTDIGQPWASASRPPSSGSCQGQAMTRTFRRAVDSAASPRARVPSSKPSRPGRRARRQGDRL